MTVLVVTYLAGWWITVFDVPADHKSWKWCLGAAIGCALWPLLLYVHLACVVGRWMRWNVK